MWRGLGLSWGWGGEGKGLVPWPWAGPVPTGPTAQALTARGCGPWGSGASWAPRGTGSSPCPRRGHRVPRNSSPIFPLPGLTFRLAFPAGGTGF